MSAADHSRTRRMAVLAAGTVGVLVTSGLVVSVVDEPVFRVSASAPVDGSGVRPAASREDGPDGTDVETDAGAPAPDGRVEIRDDWAPRPLPEGWSEVPGILDAAVADADDLGLDLSFCVQAVDTAGERFVCEGSDEERYAASVTKIAYAVAALEAYGGDPDAETSTGSTVGEIVDDAITVSDNTSADLLVLLAGSGPDALDEDPFEAINSVAARVGLDEGFHAGNYYTVSYWSPDWSHLTAEGAMRYLTELVRAADGRVEPGGEPLTSPRIARYVLDAMRRQERTLKIPRDLPKGSTANKTGETDLVSHDVAVVNTASGRYTLVAASTSYGLGGGPEEIVAETAAEVVDALGGGVRF